MEATSQVRADWSADGAIFGLAAKMVTVVMAVVALALAGSLASAVFGGKALPDGDLHLTLIRNASVPGGLSDTDLAWKTPRESYDQEFVAASTAWRQDLASSVPTSWQLRGPFEWWGGDYSLGDGVQGRYIAPTLEAVVPASQVTHKWAFWALSLWGAGALLLGLWWARGMLQVVHRRGPFEPEVSRALTRIALLGLLVPPAIAMVDSELRNVVYNDLADWSAGGAFPTRDSSMHLQLAWLALLVVALIVRHGTKLQQESDATV